MFESQHIFSDSEGLFASECDAAQKWSMKGLPTAHPDAVCTDRDQEAGDGLKSTSPNGSALDDESGSETESMEAPGTPPLVASQNETLSAPCPTSEHDTLFPAVNLCTATEEELVAAISAGIAAGTGTIRVRGLGSGVAPLVAIQELFDFVATQPELVQRANRAYKKNLIYKDTYAAGKGGPAIDQKRVLDLSPARLDEVTAVDPALLSDLGAPLREALAFFNAVRTAEVPRLRAALAKAAGAPSIASDALCNYRMVDYYQRPSPPDLPESLAKKRNTDSPAAQPPRCGEHRDFGSMTLIFQDAVGGLEVFLPDADLENGGKWVPVPPGGPGEAVMLCGWCTTFRSNGRVPAALHRVTSPPRGPDSNEVFSQRSTGEEMSTEISTEIGSGVAERVVENRRVSAVLFVAPELQESLAPTLLEGERARFKGVTAGDLRIEVGRKWAFREGTLKDQDMREQARRLAEFPTQDAYIAHAYGLP